MEAICGNDAGAKNLGVISGAVEEIIERARAKGEKAIVFLMGVPGAGKTLVGLKVATRRREMGEARAVFLSGNGPLVAVLQPCRIRGCADWGTSPGAIENQQLLLDEYGFGHHGTRAAPGTSAVDSCACVPTYASRFSAVASGVETSTVPRGVLEL